MLVCSRSQRKCLQKYVCKHYFTIWVCKFDLKINLICKCFELLFSVVCFELIEDVLRSTVVCFELMEVVSRSIVVSLKMNPFHGFHEVIKSFYVHAVNWDPGLLNQATSGHKSETCELLTLCPIRQATRHR